jgi:hypothetical protein
VRVVGLERDVVLADGVDVLQAVRIVEEAAVDVRVVVLRRRALHLVGHAAPPAVVFPHLVGALEHVRDPTDLAFAVAMVRRGNRSNTPDINQSVSDIAAFI